MSNEPKADVRAIHMSHCNQGDYEDSCKYGEDDCPALPTTNPETAGVGPVAYKALYCPGIPTDCCDYGVVSYLTGKEVCRVWDRDDAEKIAALLNAAHPAPASNTTSVGEGVLHTVTLLIEEAARNGDLGLDDTYQMPAGPNCERLASRILAAIRSGSE